MHTLGRIPTEVTRATLEPNLTAVEKEPTRPSHGNRTPSNAIEAGRWQGEMSGGKALGSARQSPTLADTLKLGSLKMHGSPSLLLKSLGKDKSYLLHTISSGVTSKLFTAAARWQLSTSQSGKKKNHTRFGCVQAKQHKENWEEKINKELAH